MLFRMPWSLKLAERKVCVCLVWAPEGSVPNLPWLGTLGHLPIHFCVPDGALVHLGLLLWEYRGGNCTHTTLPLHLPHMQWQQGDPLLAAISLSIHGQDHHFPCTVPAASSPQKTCPGTTASLTHTASDAGGCKLDGLKFFTGPVVGSPGQQANTNMPVGFRGGRCCFLPGFTWQHRRILGLCNEAWVRLAAFLLYITKNSYQVISGICK